MPVNIDNILQWQLLPLVQVDIQTSSETYKFKNIEASSTYSFNSILDDTDSGGQRVVAYEITFKVVVPQNNYSDMADYLLDISATQQIVDVMFYLEGTKSMTMTAKNDTSQTSIGFNIWNVNISVVPQSKESPSLIISGSTLLNVSALAKKNPFYFNQLWSTIDD
jgi:hypothetical protein